MMIRVSRCWTVPVAAALAAAAFSAAAQTPPPVRHYVYFGGDREAVRRDTAFLRAPHAAGAQVRYFWRQLEPRKGIYEFSVIRDDIAFLASHGKQLWIQLQDVSFSPERNPAPDYLSGDTDDPAGVSPQYRELDDGRIHATVTGWVAQRWNRAVQERLHQLFDTLGREFDGRIAGINLAETSLGFGKTGNLAPGGFSPDRYRDATIENMRALKRAFRRSVAMVYANFMPGEWRPTDDKGYLVAVYGAARELGIAVGGPDLLPLRPGQRAHAYALMQESKAVVPVGIAVQDGNFADVHPRTRHRLTRDELLRYAVDTLGARYIFWGTEEPYYSEQVLPLLAREQQP